MAVTFSSDAFNTSEQKDYFINPNCFGDDLAAWLMARLKEKGIQVEDDGPDQEDFGWYLNFELEGNSYSCVVLYQEGAERWMCILEFNAGFFGSILGKRNKKVPQSPANAINSILLASEDIADIQWENIEL